jgi:hypothetical protein
MPAEAREPAVVSGERKNVSSELGVVSVAVKWEM